MLIQRSPTFAGEEVPLDEARRTSRGPRMDPERYHAFKGKNPIAGQHRYPHATPGGYKPDDDEKPRTDARLSHAGVRPHDVRSD